MHFNGAHNQAPGAQIVPHIFVQQGAGDAHISHPRRIRQHQNDVGENVSGQMPLIINGVGMDGISILASAA